jgi:peptide/nickel transport system substrate-binding protein
VSSAPELRGGTVTFLFTDVEGSTALLKRVGRDRYHALLGRHHELVRSAIATHYGEEVDTQGDEFFVAFASASDAVAAAADIQRSLADDGEIRVRIGIHSGEASVAGGRYVGFSVHRAARIGAAAHGGQVLLSETTRTLVEDDLPAGVALRDLGPFRLKDIERPERITQLVIDGLPADFPPLRGAQPLEQPPPFRRRSLLAGALAGVIAAAVAIPVFALGGSGGGTALAGIAANAVGAIDPDGRISDSIPATVAPTEVAVGAGKVWVTSADGNSVVEIDPQTHAKVQTYSVGKGPTGVAFGGGFVWVANSLDNTVSQIDPQAQMVVGKPVPVGNGPIAVAYGDGSVWVANSGDRTVMRIDPKTSRRENTYQAAAGADALAVGPSGLWVVSESDGSVTRIDPRKGVPPAVVNVGNGPDAVSVGQAAVWVANGLDDTVSEIVDPSSNPRVEATVQVGESPSGIAMDDHAVWVSNGGSATVSRIDPAHPNEPTTVETKNPPAGIATAPDAVYVAVQASALAHRGGTVRVVQGAPWYQPSPIDPAHQVLDPADQIAYQGYETLSLTNDGLVAFKHAGGTEGTRLVPDLATRLPTPSDRGKTYTFEVRSGIHYSNGQLVRPADFRRAIQGALLGPAALYYSGIVGGAECVTPRRCDLGRGIVTSGNTITFHLTARDPDFPFKLAMPWAYAVPAHAGLPVPATGPYEITRPDLKRGMTLVRNPRFHEWSAAAQPDGVPKRIVFDWSGTPESRTRAVERGDADVLFDGVPGDLGQEVQTRYPTQTHVDPVLATSFFVLNSRRRPFNNLQARQAVNYAVDRAKLAGLLGPRIYHRPSCQLLPPGLEGYERYCPFKYDLRKARALVAASGTKGATVTVLGCHAGICAGPVDQYLIRVLDKIGYRAHPKLVKDTLSFYANLSNSRRMPEVGGIAGWALDFPSPAGVLTTLLTCSAFKAGTPNNANWAEFCNRRIDAEIKRADELQLQQTDFRAAAELWMKIDRDVTLQAPFVVVENSRSLTLVSPQVGNYTYNMVWAVPFLDQLWVK